ncbi:MAG: hypothetical protein L6437_04450 [Kiritimatiellae bacterium]|nr:hypothetical protein [Verrucomicrobiota bacterium]MCG2659482.1 hypothetical protein [Kiritimatiellia bacterium]
MQRPRPDRWIGLDLVWIILVVAACYAPSLPAWFHGDDFVHLDLLSEHRPNVLNNIWKGALTGEMPDHCYRPLANTTFYLFNEGSSAVPLRLFILILHGITVLMLRQVLLGAGAGRLASAGGAILFALHPAIHVTVLWVSALGDVLATSFCLLALLCYQRLTRPGPRNWLILLCYLGAVLSKETGFVLPGLLMLVSWRDRRLLKDARLWCGMILLAALVLAVRTCLIGNLAAGPRTGYYFNPGMQTFVSMAKYVYALAVPFPWYWTYAHPWLAVSGLMVPVGAAVVLWKAGWRDGGRDLIMVAGLMMMPLLPVINVYANWYLYMSAIGFGYAASCLFRVLPRNVSLVILFTVGAWYGYTTVDSSRTFLRAGEAEQAILTDLANIPEQEFIVVGMPRQYRGVPMMTFSHHLQLALRRFRGVDKNIELPATTALADLNDYPEMSWREDHRLQLAFSGRKLSYFDLFRTRGTPWKSHTRVITGNKWGLPVAISLELPGQRTIYACESAGQQPVFRKIERP